MERRVLITGIAGLLGSHAADRFISEGWDVIGIDNLVGGYLRNIPEKAKFINADCTDYFSMVEIIERFKPDTVIHAACTAYEGLSVFSPSLVYDNTASATISILSASIRHRVKRFIFCSSMARYGDANGKIFTEDMVPKPQDPYGIAKVSSEQVIKNLAQVHGLEFVILVPHNIIGPRQKFDDPYRNVASIMINRMLRGLPPIIYGDGMQTRSFSFVNDVVNPMYISATSKQVVGEVINVGPDGNEITILELSKILGRLLNVKLEPLFYRDRPQEVKHAVCSADKARSLLNYEAKTPIEDGLIEMINYIKSVGPKEFDYAHRIEIDNELTPKTWVDKTI